MRLEVRGRLGELADRWDGLAASQRLPTPFVSSWWVENASDAAKAILCLFDGEELVGGAAFEVDCLGPAWPGPQRVRFVGQGPLAPDHLDVIAAPGRHSEVSGVVAEWLLGSPRVIDLDGVSESSLLPRLLDAEVVSTSVAPYLALEDDSWAAALPGRLRSTISRSRKRLEREGFSVRQVPPAEAPRALETLRRLHDERWQDGSSLAGHWDLLRRSIEAGARCGDVVLHELADGEGDVIASELEMTAGRRLCYYQAGRLTDREYRGSGSVLRAAIADWGRGEGYVELDLLRGDESYKADWATGRRVQSRIRCGSTPYTRAVARLANLWLRKAPELRAALDRVRSRSRSSATS